MNTGRIRTNDNNCGACLAFEFDKKTFYPVAAITLQQLRLFIEIPAKQAGVSTCYNRVTR
jgi:hypothetical protein